MIGTSLYSMIRQFLYILMVFISTSYVGHSKGDSAGYIFFGIVATSIFFSNFCAWSLNKMLRKQKINLDSVM